MNQNNAIPSIRHDFKNALKVMMTISGIAVLGVVLYYIFFISKGYYHSDCTDTITWAQAVVDGKSLINPDFKYACLLPFGGQLLMVPFVAIFGFGMKAQLIGMALFAIIFTASLVYLCRSMNCSYRWCSVTVAVVLLILSASEKLREIFWCHIIYYSLGILFLMIGLALTINILKSEKPKLHHIIILFIWTILCSTNGSQAITIYVLPVIAAIFAERFFDMKTPLFASNNRKSFFIITIMILAMLFGIFLSFIINGDAIASYQEAYSKFDKKSDWINNFLNVILGIFTLLGIDASNCELFSLDGIFILIKIICALIIMIVPVIMLFMYRKFQDISYRLMILAHTVLSILILMGWIFGLLNTACWRLSPMLATATILCVMFVKWLYDNKYFVRLSAIIIIPLSFVLMMSVIDIAQNAVDGQTEENKQLESVSEYLEENNLEYGYATFWNANIITLLSDSKVKVRCVNEYEGLITKSYYQTNVNWYKDNSYDRYFLLLDSDEYTAYTENPLFLEPMEILCFEDKYILIYNYNFMENK